MCSSIFCASSLGQNKKSDNLYTACNAPKRTENTIKRLTKITTKTGDTGSTGLADGSRLPKQHIRLECLGTQDELLAHLGLITTKLPPGCEHIEQLQHVQQLLFNFGAELSLPGHAVLKEEHVAALESDIARLTKTLPPLREFVLPGAPEAAAHVHVARTVCRRLERACWALQTASRSIAPCSLIWLNRLSDWLFVLARLLTREACENEPQWQHPS